MTGAGIANAHCPWSSEPVSPDSLTEYRGHTVGFCNPGCRDKFDAAISTFDNAIGASSDGAALDMVRRFGRYNGWFNQRLVAAVKQVSSGDYRRDLGAYFGSIETTLNHIMVWDIVWLKRIASSLGHFECLRPLDEHAMPTTVDQILFSRRTVLAKERGNLDQLITRFTEGLVLSDLDLRVAYRRQSGTRFEHSLAEVLHHMFNHQTHHRGQITTLLAQLSIDPGVTDMIAMVIDEQAEGEDDD